ncbi:MAG: helix-turn-helix domain-containing protein [Candidatus Thorarchaeota archaeon]
MPKKPFKPNKSLSEISEKSGMSVSYISRILKGERIPRVHNFKKIADALKMSMDLLYKKLERFYK